MYIYVQGAVQPSSSSSEDNQRSSSFRRRESIVPINVRRPRVFTVTGTCLLRSLYGKQPLNTARDCDDDSEISLNLCVPTPCNTSVPADLPLLVIAIANGNPFLTTFASQNASFGVERFAIGSILQSHGQEITGSHDKSTSERKHTITINNYRQQHALI